MLRSHHRLGAVLDSNICCRSGRQIPIRHRSTFSSATWASFGKPTISLATGRMECSASMFMVRGYALRRRFSRHKVPFRKDDRRLSGAVSNSVSAGIGPSRQIGFPGDHDLGYLVPGVAYASRRHWRISAGYELPNPGPAGFRGIVFN